MTSGIDVLPTQRSGQPFLHAGPADRFVRGKRGFRTLGRLVIYTSRIDQIADIYAKHVGFLVLQADHDRVVELRAQDSGMGLLLHPAAANQKEGQVLVKLVFDGEDVLAFCEVAKANGLEFGKIHKAGSYEFANSKDPSKNSIQVSSRTFRQ